MISAREIAGIAGIGPAQPGPPVAAYVEEGAHRAPAVPHHQDRVFSHIGAEEIPRIGDLALMAQKQPAAGEDALQLLLVDVALDENAPTDEAVIDINQTLDVRQH